MPKLAEWHIYGNEQQGRFVTLKPETEPCYYLGGVTNDVANLNFFRILDKKEYELKDHLGNVRVAIGDMKLPENEATSTRGVSPFVTDEKAVNDYYPFGMTIAERSYQGSNYNYSYNKGSEKDNEIYPNQEGRAITTFYREGDLSGVRWWSLDPKAAEQAYQSPYNMMDCNPILNNDVLGDQGPNPMGMLVAKYNENVSPAGKAAIKMTGGMVQLLAAGAMEVETAGIASVPAYYIGADGLYTFLSGSRDLVAATVGDPNGDPYKPTSGNLLGAVTEKLTSISPLSDNEKNVFNSGAEFLGDLLAAAYNPYKASQVIIKLDKMFCRSDILLDADKFYKDLQSIVPIPSKKTSPVINPNRNASSQLPDYLKVPSPINIKETPKNTEKKDNSNKDKKQDKEKKKNNDNSSSNKNKDSKCTKGS